MLCFKRLALHSFKENTWKIPRSLDFHDGSLRLNDFVYHEESGKDGGKFYVNNNFNLERKKSTPNTKGEQAVS